MTKNITIFRNIKETDTPFYVSIENILTRIKDGKTKELVKSIRQETDKKKRNEIKNSFKFITMLFQLVNKQSGINKVVNKIKNREIPSTPIV